MSNQNLGKWVSFLSIEKIESFKNAIQIFFIKPIELNKQETQSQAE